MLYGPWSTVHNVRHSSDPLISREFMTLNSFFMFFYCEWQNSRPTTRKKSMSIIAAHSAIYSLFLCRSFHILFFVLIRSARRILHSFTLLFGCVARNVSRWEKLRLLGNCLQLVQQPWCSWWSFYCRNNVYQQTENMFRSCSVTFY